MKEKKGLNNSPSVDSTPIPSAPNSEHTKLKLKMKPWVWIIIATSVLSVICLICYYFWWKSIADPPRTVRNQTITPPTEGIDFGPQVEPSGGFVAVENKEYKIVFLDREGQILGKCGHDSGSNTVLVALDSSLVAYRKLANINLIEENCKSERQITFEGRSETDQYYAIQANPLSWSPDGRRLLYSLETAESQLPRVDRPGADEITGFYIYDLETNKSEKIISQPTDDPWPNFFGWPESFENPIFRKVWDFYEYNLDQKTSRQIDKSIQLPSSSVVFLSKSAVLWVDSGVPYNNPPDGYSQIVISNINNSKKMEVSPKGRYADYTSGKISPDKEKIAYIWTNDRSHKRNHIKIFNISSRTTKDLDIEGVTDYLWYDSGTILFVKDGSSFMINIDTKQVNLFAKDIFSVY